MEKKKKIFIIISIIIVTLLVATVGVFVFNKLKWKDYETCKTDKFTIKYPKEWEVEDYLDEMYGKTFKGTNDTVEFYLMKKSEMPDTRNTAAKLKNETLKQLDDSSMEKLSENSWIDYKVSKLNTEDIKVSGLNGYRIEFEISGIAGITEISVALIYIEDDTYLYCMSLEGEDLETFNKMVESVKIK